MPIIRPPSIISLNPIISGLQTEIDATETDVSQLQSDVSDIENIQNHTTNYFTSNLSQTPIINGIARPASWIYNPLGATTTLWSPIVGTDTLHISGTGADLERSPGNYIQFKGTKFLLSNDITLLNMGTQDFVFEMIARVPSVAISRLYLFSGVSTLSPFFLVYWENSILGFSCEFRVSGNVLTRTAAMAIDARWVHLMWFVNRDEASIAGSEAFSNGNAGLVGSNFSGQSANHAPNTAMNLGGGSFAGIASLVASIAWIGLWKGTNMIQAGLAGRNEIAALAASRYAQLEFPV